MVVEQDDLWLCIDCVFVAVNGDSSGIDDERQAEKVEAAVAAMGPHLVPDFDSDTEDGIDEFSRRVCDCCGSLLAGSRHRFAILGEG